jgi:predicted HAD superfamily phosphohydrolase YqeG
MRTRYERHCELDEVLDRAGKLSVRTIIFDVEPLVSWWDNTQESLDWGVAMVVGKVAALPTVRALVFSTNSVRRPSAVPAGRDIEVSYLASAAKPLRTAPYRDLPRPGAVVGDQVPTDGLLARRLGYTFLHYQPRRGDIPLGPRLMHRVGRLALPLLFSRREDSLPLAIPCQHPPLFGRFPASSAKSEARSGAEAADGNRANDAGEQLCTDCQQPVHIPQHGDNRSSLR